MSYIPVPVRTIPDLNSNADINQLQENISIITNKKVVTLYDATTYSFTTTWVATLVFPEITGFQPNSRVKLFYHVPCRNDSTSWGGVYLEPQISFNSGSTWSSLGSGGFDGGVMNNVSADIGTFNNTIIINPSIATTFSVKIRFYSASYDGTGTINGSHNINTISGTAALLTGTNGNQHFAHIIVEELLAG